MEPAGISIEYSSGTTFGETATYKCVPCDGCVGSSSLVTVRTCAADGWSGSGALTCPGTQRVRPFLLHMAAPG